MALPGNALVVGAGSGICRATAVAFAKEGVAGLMVADVNLDAALKTAEEAKLVATNPKFDFKAIRVDVSQQNSVREAIATMTATFGRIDYCVNGAAITGHSFCSISEMDLDMFKQVQDVNVNGTLVVMSEASKAMLLQEPLVIDETMPSRGEIRGSIVNMASVLSTRALPGVGAYSTSKHAVEGLTRAAAIDNIPHKIRVNCVCPSWVETPMVTSSCDSMPGLSEVLQSQLPMGRLGLPEEVADCIMFLCSPKASWVNGSSMAVDGAMSIRL
ncbi:hypothetical protein F4780DRAFT_661738 [Xylariomycetidae sp. FL0641]|nr:hypothetical protein F4780DRAFT_661738 [Xylariomycetidae sp. FL0641]